MNNKIILIILLALVSLTGAFYLYNKDTAIVRPVACTEEAKICPDGTAVGRVGPNCEFTECPITQTKEGTIAALNQKILNRGVFITPLEVVSDSRCPVDVTCIWAGEISLKIRFEKGTIIKEEMLKEGTSITFEGNKISLTSVTPANNTKKPFNKEDYRFTFSVIKQDAPIVNDPKGKCYIGGCSGQICSDKEGMASTCEYREEYACYKTAICERQSSGECNWTQTLQLNTCLKK